MADFTNGGGAVAPSSPGVAGVFHWIGAGLSLALVAGIGIWGYKLIARDVSGVPVVRAMEGPMRVAPADPGGQMADHQGLAVNEVAGQGEASGPVNRLVLAPRPAGLAEEDVALGKITDTKRIMRPSAPPPTAAAPQPEPQQAAPVPVPVPVPEPVPQLAEPIPAPEPAPADDPILALAEQLASGAAPLTDLQPADPGTPSPLVAPRAEPEPQTVAQPGVPVQGLAVSLRPKLRPQGLRVASRTTVTDVVPTVAPAPAVSGRERDADTLAPGTRLVQIGAFDSPETARAEWTRLEARFGDYLEDKDRVIQRATSGGRVFYRLRAHGFEDLAAARRFCAAFVAGNVDCIPVVTR